VAIQPRKYRADPAARIIIPLCQYGLLYTAGCVYRGDAARAKASPIKYVRSGLLIWDIIFSYFAYTTADGWKLMQAVFTWSSETCFPLI
jgi:hypothetical protein